MTIFWTIVSGAAVFVLSQYILKIVIEPSIELKRTIAELASELLFHQAKITNNNDPDEKISQALSQFSARLRSGSFVLPAYERYRRVFGLPSQDSIRLACQQINLIASNLGQKDDKQQAAQNFEAIQTIGKALGVSTSY